MRFIIKEHKVLHEDESAPRDWKKEFSKATKGEKHDIIKDWINSEEPIGARIKSYINSGTDGADKLIDTIVHSIELRTFSLWANPFLKLLTEFDFDITDNIIDNISSLVPLAYGPTKLDLNSKYLNNLSLYDRNANDFDYSVKMLQTVNDSGKLSTYFKDTSKVSPEHLYDSSGKIKPAGLSTKKVDYDKKADGSEEMLPPEEQSTIFGTAEAWSANGNDKGGPNKDKKSDTNVDNVNSNKKKIYKSTQEATEDGMNRRDTRITVQQDYIFNGKEWVVAPDETPNRK